MKIHLGSRKWIAPALVRVPRTTVLVHLTNEYS